jgi:hypothetical protein
VSLFKFILDNKDTIEELAIDKEGYIKLLSNEFDFSHSDVEVETNETEIIFSIEVGIFTLVCVVDIDNLADCTDKLVRITNVDTRKMIIEMLEDKYRYEADMAYDMAKDNLSEAQQQVVDAKKDYDCVVNSLNDLKKNWRIP